MAGKSAPIPRVRPRGADAHRLETFVDAAFAFALTLLVISFDAVPASYAELIEALRGVPAFAASFAIIIMLWVAHRNWSRYYGLRDNLSVLISIVLIFVVMVYVYPLRSMMATAISTMTGGWAPGNFGFSSIADVRGLFTIYGIGFTIASACILLLYLRAARLAQELELTAAERCLTNGAVTIWAVIASMGMVSVLLAQVLPAGALGLAGFVYALLGIVCPLLGIIADRRARKHL